MEPLPAGFDLSEPLASAFRSWMSRVIVVIHKRNAAEESFGTGFIAGRLVRKDRTTRRPIIVTAGHVVEHDRSLRTEWTVVGDWREGRWQREVEFVTHNKTERDSNVMWFKGKHYDDAQGVPYDVGCLEFPNDACEREFLKENEWLPTQLGAKTCLTQGSRVAWAGFPHILYRKLGTPTLSYFEGTVSALIEDPPAYVLEGFNNPGLSGSPVWHWNPTLCRPEIAGIITHHEAYEDQFPGLVYASHHSPMFIALKNRGQDPGQPG